MAMIDNVGRYYQIGCAEAGCDMYTLSVTIDTATGLLQVVTKLLSLISITWIVVVVVMLILYFKTSACFNSALLMHGFVYYDIHQWAKPTVISWIGHLT